MRCHVYRSSIRDGLYVYVAALPEPDESAETDDAATLATLPDPVRRQLGSGTERAMTLELDEGRRLGQEDVHEVLANLAAQGFHVQMPRDIEPQVTSLAEESVARAASGRAASTGSAARRPPRPRGSPSDGPRED